MNSISHAWYYLEIPPPAPSAPAEKHLAYSAIAGFMQSTVLIRSVQDGIPEPLKAAIRAYAAKWEPKMRIPSD